MSDEEIVAFLATVPLLEGRDEADLAELARVMHRRTVRAGETLFRQGEHGQEVLFVVDGAVATSLRLPGDRTAEIGTAGRGGILGELALLDGQMHTLSARVTETATLLALGPLDFAGLLSGQQPSAFVLRRRLTSLLCGRFRAQLRYLAESLGGESDAPSAGAALALADLEQCKAPDSGYVRRMAAFHDFDRLALWGFLTSGKYFRCPPGRTLVPEGALSPAYYLTINGAVEKALVRGDRRIRIGLAGPGMAFGYESLIDGQPSPVAVVTRERSLLLALPRDVFDRIVNNEDATCRVFMEAIQRDLVATLRKTLRPCARLAVSL